MPETILDVRNLETHFVMHDAVIRAVAGVSFHIAKGETLGIVGESGSGKSVTNLSLLGLIPQPPGKIVWGEALYRGRDLLQLPEPELRDIRGHHIAMIFQDPMSSLNPFMTVADQLTEVTIRHLKHTPAQALAHAIQLLERVGIARAAERIHGYPHEFSGGMRQRVMIAMALLCSPDLLIADEPTTALDVTIQAQILELMQKLQQETGTAIILITHDLGVIAKMCHRVQVMYAGRVIEEATVDELFAEPQHPYTRGLLESMPRIDAPRDQPLVPIPGQPPDLGRLPKGCAFAPRCPLVEQMCHEQIPPLVTFQNEHRHACLVQAQRGAVAAS